MEDRAPEACVGGRIESVSVGPEWERCVATVRTISGTVFNVDVSTWSLSDMLLGVPVGVLRLGRTSTWQTEMQERVAELERRLEAYQQKKVASDDAAAVQRVLDMLPRGSAITGVQGGGPLAVILFTKAT